MKPSLTLGPSRWFIGFLSTWLAFALLLAARSTLLHSPLPPPAIGLLLTGAILLIVWWWETAREQVRRLGPAPLVGFHVIRLFVGAYFLILYQRGVLPAEFAILAGWGDIAVGASAALVLWFCIPVRTLGQRYGLLAWNTIGLIDILLVLSNGIRLFASDPGIGLRSLPFRWLFCRCSLYRWSSRRM